MGLKILWTNGWSSSKAPMLSVNINMGVMSPVMPGMYMSTQENQLVVPMRGTRELELC